MSKGDFTPEARKLIVSVLVTKPLWETEFIICAQQSMADISVIVLQMKYVSRVLKHCLDWHNLMKEDEDDN